jgi:hypothetical protein
MANCRQLWADISLSSPLLSSLTDRVILSGVSPLVDSLEIGLRSFDPRPPSTARIVPVRHQRPALLALPCGGRHWRALFADLYFSINDLSTVTQHSEQPPSTPYSACCLQTSTNGNHHTCPSTRHTVSKRGLVRRI